MAERDQRTKIIKLLRPLGAIPVENPVWPGTPDVNFIGGWMELKWLRCWPAQPSTVVRLEHYTKQQQLFAKQRKRYGGQVWFMLQCKREWLLLRGEVAAEFVNRVPRQGLIDVCFHHWKDGIVGKELIDCLKRG